MSFIAKLYLDNQVYNILIYRILLRKNTTGKEIPEAKKMSRNLYLTLESQGNETKNLLCWTLDSESTKNGKIVFFKRDAMSKLQEIQLKNAYCVYFQEKFSASGTEPMQINLEIRNGILCGSEVENKLLFAEPEPLPEKEPEIMELRIMDENFENELEEIPSNSKCCALVKTRYAKEGEEISIQINENTEDENENILLLSGIVDAEGYAKLEEIQNKFENS